MSQVVGFPGNGLQLKGRTRLLVGDGDPSTSATPDVQSAGVSSLFLRLDVAGIYLCTAAGVLDSVGGAVITAATWTQITTP
jgi:hypothetical protein